MSTQSRRIGHYSLNFIKHRSQEDFFDIERFINLLDYIKSLPTTEQIVKNNITNIATVLDSYKVYDKSGYKFAEIIFKSAKFNHSPEYMSTIDGTERDSDKKLFEGEKELTHIMCRFDAFEALTILEERKAGVSIGPVTKYLNGFNKQYLRVNGLKINYSIKYSLVPDRDFLVELEGFNKISAAEIVVSKRILGSEVLNLNERIENIKNEVVISMKADSKKSIGKLGLKSAFKSVKKGDQDIYRIRITGYDDDGVKKVIDSEYIRKVNSVTVSLNSKGIVVSHSIFEKMTEIMGMENE